MSTTQIQISLTTFTCGCGIVYGLNERFVEKLRENHNTFYCPNGCRNHFPQETKEERLEKELHRERQQHDQTKADLEYKEKSLRSNKGQMTKLKNRIEKGVCPHCNRYFKNLHKHIQGKHNIKNEKNI